MNQVREKVGVDLLHKKGILGQGIGVAVLDTGISPHPDFGKRIVAFQDFSEGRARIYDDCSHGSHVAGILGGSGRLSGGRYRGIAPSCHLIGLKILDRFGNGNKEELLQAVNWTIKNKDRYNIRILNISVGSVREGAKAADELTACVEAAWDEGLIVVVAAGNKGPGSMSVTVPGNSRKVITVGAYDDCQRGNCFSGRGPTADCICKPDITAPGAIITSCGNYPTGRLYTTKSGTSMATPVVSGCIALLLSQNPEYTNVGVKMRLWQAAVDLGLPRERQGWGAIDAGRLLSVPQ
jgi:serine protease AprX